MPTSSELLTQAEVCLQDGRLSEAESNLGQLALAVPHPAAWCNLMGRLELLRKRFAPALPWLDQAVQAAPQLAAAWSNRGSALFFLGRKAEAGENYRQALSLDPSLLAPAVNLSHILRAEKKLPEAEILLRQTLRYHPRDPTVLHTLSGILYEQDAEDEPTALLHLALAERPAFIEASVQLASHLLKKGRLADAEATMRAALERTPKSPTGWVLLGKILRVSVRIREAESCFRQALAIDPDHADALCHLGVLLFQQGLASVAAPFLLRAHAKYPQQAEPCVGLGLIALESGAVDEGIGLLRQAIALAPGEAIYLSGLLFSESLHGTRSPAEILVEARTWEGRLTGVRRLSPRRPRRDRPVRVGYVSADFRKHAISFFVAPVFAAHDPTRVEVFAYGSVAAPDEVTARLRAMVPNWHSIHALSDQQAAELIHAHEIDILVDLGGHTRNSRLAVLARRPAPIQASWIGYFASTGLSTVDYWITDVVIHPASDSEAATETIWRLPRCWVSYQPPGDAPLPSFESERSFTFGSFNRFGKFSHATVQLWARILLAIPGTRLLLKNAGVQDPVAREQLARSFAAYGVDAERLVFVGRTASFSDHLGLYARVDVALDTFPMNGATTSCDALWMGVPLVALAGSTYGSRMSASMLSALGRPEWIATTADQYVATAISLHAELATLSSSERLARRQTLRAQMAASSLCDGASLARALEDAYANMVSLRRRDGCP